MPESEGAPPALAEGQPRVGESHQEPARANEDTDSTRVLAGYASDFGGSSARGGSPTPNSTSEERGTPSEAQEYKNVMNASGSIRKEPRDYQLKDGEGELHEPSLPELAQHRLAMQHAVEDVPRRGPNDEQTDPNDPNKKFGFPYNFFDHAFHSPDSTDAQQHSVTLKGGKKLPLEDDGKRDTTSVDRLAHMMPSSLTADGHLERLSQEPDPAHQAKSGDDSKVSSNKFFESAAALKYARDQGYDPATVQRHSATVDFRAKNQQGEDVHFDPFMSPQPPQLSNQGRQMKRMIEKKNYNEASKKESPLTPEAEAQLKTKVDNEESNQAKRKEPPERWVKNTYLKHTDNSKASASEEKVTGVWDQTSTSAPDLQKLEEAAKKAENGKPGNLAPVDLNLAGEYAREDLLARQQIEHRNRNASQTTDASRE